MAESLVLAVIEKLIQFGSQYLKDQAIWWWSGMKDELERLRMNHLEILAVVGYASTLELLERKNQALNEWMWMLRDAIDEANDVMEELEFLKLEETREGCIGCIVQFINEKLVKMVKRALKIDPTLNRLEEVVHKLDQLSVRSGNFLQLAKDARQEHQEEQRELNKARETGSSHTDVDYIGRGEDEKCVMQWLRTTSNDSHTNIFSNISLLSIVGQGGMGKTTLLQKVYNEEMKNEFDLKIWACVSKDFNKDTIIKLILESATKDRSSLVAFDALQQTLKDTVNSKKYLLVLDDIWDEEDKEMNKRKWQDVLAPLAHGKLGSKILVTTRMETVAKMLSNIIGKNNEMLTLKSLNDDECLQLLNKHAFKGEDPKAYPQLSPIAKKIVKKLSGSPLAAKVIGGVLSSGLNITHWNRVLNYNIGSHKGILDILKLSYLFLPKVLRNCYSFCCTFPQDYGFYKDDLVRMWIALGFIQPDNSRGETMKDVGERYFDTLVQISLFDKFQNWNKMCYYKLHDLLHEMLRTFSTQECCSIVGGDEGLLSTTPKTIRHLFAKDVNLAVLRKVMKEFKHLRSFILIDPKMHEDLVYMLAKIFKKLRSIRLIFIDGYLKNIPKEIEDLIHLRYLKIDCNYGLSGQVSLPAFWRFPFLKYLFLYSMKEVKGFNYKFHGNEKIRVFPSLQVLHIEELTALKNLFIATEAAYECLFPCLTELHLECCPNLLELIALPPKMEKLKIDRIFPSLQVVRINRLEALKNLFIATEAAYECLFPCLTELHIYNCPNLLELIALSPKIEKLEIGRIFPSLQVLDIRVNEALEDWFVAKAAAYECLFPCLTELCLSNCPNLLELPAGLPCKLEKLEINNIGWKGSNWIQGISRDTRQPASLPLWQLPFLKCLHLLRMPDIKGFDFEFHGNEKVLVFFPSLQELYIAFLTTLEDWFVAKAAAYECVFPCLTELTLMHCPKLLELPDVPGLLPKLEKLKVWGVEWKGSNWLQGISSNCNISIDYCSNLLSLKGDQVMETPEKCQLILSKLVINDPSLLLKVPLTSVTSIEELGIEFNDEIISFSIDGVKEWILKVSPSLCNLKFESLELLQLLPFFSESISSLKSLEVSFIPLLQQLPNMPASLEKLFLNLLPQLRELPDLPPTLHVLKICGYHPDFEKRYQRDTGSDWHKIAHIPKVSIEEDMDSYSNYSSDSSAQ